ncbi:MAG TPA: FtsX-like permease family protein, partial [Blastocatellia bacterium]|nr:FtsX-like permease family protein [Blastocatellia bacterium]
LHVRTSGKPTSVAAAVRHQVQSLDPNLPVTNLEALTEVLAGSLFAARMGAVLLAIFGLVALLLAAVGLYGLMSYGVARRTREIGIRMALGADRANIISLLLKQGMTPVVVGLAMGLLGAWSLKKVLSELLHGVSSTDFVTYVIVIILIILTAVVATLLPSHRATEIDPLTALRQE